MPISADDELNANRTIRKLRIVRLAGGRIQSAIA